MAAGGGMWAFYYIQGEDGEDRSHPNAFKIPSPSSSSGDVTLADVLRHFPLPDATATFHFRFRINASVKSASGSATSTFFWLDVASPTQKVPLVNGRVICKLLRLARPQKTGLLFKRKPVLQWAEPSHASSDPLAKPKSKPVSLVRQSSGSSGGYDKDRPAKYSDKYADTPSRSGTPPPAGGAASSLHTDRTASGGSGSQSGSGPPSRTGSGSSAVQEPPPPAPESFEDFLSGGQSTQTSRASVNLMSDSGWSDDGHAAAGGASAQPRTVASDFLNSMDPLAQQQQQQQRAHRMRGGSAPPQRSTDPPKFEDDGGQTVGPVTMAEMQKFAVSSDGSNVYNAKFVDKASKSDDVRRAMEERERQMQADVDKARDELRQREMAKTQLSAMKDSAGAVIGPKLKAWAEDNGRVKNIRTLLSTMHVVMWDDSKWTEVNMGKLIQTNDIKKQYRKAMIVVHPDKSSGRNAEQLLIAERVFAALNTAWDDFMKTNPC